MQVDLLIPELLWPGDDAAEVMRGLELPALERWLSRCPVSRQPGGTMQQWLWRRFCSADDMPENANDIPLAALTYASDGGDPGSDWWMRADPVHFVVGRTGLRLAPQQVLQLRPDEADALAVTLARHFGAGGPRFDARTTQRWYVGAQTAFDIETTAPGLAAGHELDSVLPRGPQRMHWVGVLNEVQMLWHEHPVNRAREQRGEPVASSLWFHGAGRLPALRQSGFARVAGGDSLAAALAHCSGLVHQPLPADAATWLADTAAGASSGSGATLLIADALSDAYAAGDPWTWRESLQQIERAWLQPLDHARRAGRISALRLHAPGTRASLEATIGRHHAWRLWARPQPLASHA